MTAEQDIAAIDDGGANTAAEVRTALTAVLARADGAAARMSKSSSQTLTQSVENTITFDVEEFDTDGDLVDLANNRFVIQADGSYLIDAAWLWEASDPDTSAFIDIKKDGSSFTTIIRGDGTPAAASGIDGSRIVSLEAGDLITMIINPGAGTGTTARGNASPHLSTAMAIAKLT